MSDPRTPQISAVPVLTQATVDRIVARFPDPPAPVHHETDDEARERQARANAVRAQSWRPDPKFHGASYDSLTTHEDPGGRISSWWQHGGSNLVIRGEINGNGKSHAAHAIGNTAVQQGAWAATWPVSRLNAAMRPNGDETAFDVAASVDLLVLDDLGAEQITEWTLERLGDLLDIRSRTRRTIITTNLTGPQVVARYDGRIVSRILDGAWVVEFTGPTFRVPAPW